jgi:hypothetical protein
MQISRSGRSFAEAGHNVLVWRLAALNLGNVRMGAWSFANSQLGLSIIERPLLSRELR